MSCYRIETNTKEGALCFGTGKYLLLYRHRPDKLPWGTDERDPRCTRLKERLGQALERAYQSGCRHFICGMARGADLYFAEAVLALRACFPQVTLEGARPCESQADRWAPGGAAPLSGYPGPVRL